MIGFLLFLAWCAAIAGIILGALFVLAYRLQAKAISMGVLPPEIGDILRARRRPRPTPDPGPVSLFLLARGIERPMPPVPPSPLMMREHMIIVDTHLVRAQEYVSSLGADGQGAHLADLFKKIRAARRALRVVALDERSGDR